MNSKQRVLNAIGHREVDRLPRSFAANRFVREKLMKKTGCRQYKDLLHFYRVDVVDLRDCIAPGYCGPVPYTSVLDGHISENFWGWQTKVVQTRRGPEEQFCNFKLKKVSCIEELEHYNWPSPDWFDFSDFKEKLEPYSQWCLMASGASVFQHPTFLRGMDTFLMDLIVNPEIAEFIMDKFTGFYLSYFERMFESARGLIDVFRVADDVAMQTGLLIGTDMFDYYVAPRLKKLIDLAHHYDIQFMLHSCGDVSSLIPSFIELGIDILDPIQVSASNMDLFDLHKQYGGQICLHGGIDTQQFLPNASPREVSEEAGRIDRYFSNKSGYIFSTSHVIEGDVPLENIEALYRRTSPD